MKTHPSAPLTTAETKGASAVITPMKILTVIAWLLALAIFCATSAYLIVMGHPYMGLIVLCFIYGLKLKIEVD